MSERLFHFLDGPALERIQNDPERPYAPASLDSEGFVHLSFAAELEGTLAAHFREVERVVLAEIDPAVDALVVEPSRDGLLFPHVYAPIPAKRFLRFWWLDREEATWTLPAFGDIAERDHPSGIDFDLP